MKKLICLIAGLLMLTGCVSTEFNRASFINEMSQTDFYEKASGDKAGKSKEEYNAIALECWEIAIRKLPPTFSKQQLKEIEPVYKLYLALKMSSDAIISKEDFLDAAFTMDHYDRYLNEIDVGLSRLEVNTIVKHCFEKEIENLPNVFSFDQFEAFEPFIDLCVHNKLDKVKKISMAQYFESFRRDIIDDRFPIEFELIRDELATEYGFNKQEIKAMMLDCLRERMKDLPAMVTLGELEESNSIFNACMAHKLKID